MTAESGIQYALWTIVGLLIVNFLRPYLAKKGENMATHEDIEKLVDQVRAVTETTEEIKASISNEEREWQLKKELLREMTSQIAELQQNSIALVGYRKAHVIAMYDHERNEITKAQSKAVADFRDSLARFSATRMMMDVLFKREVCEQTDTTMQALADMADSTRGLNPPQLKEHSDEVNSAITTLMAFLRKEMMTEKPRQVISS